MNRPAPVAPRRRIHWTRQAHYFLKPNMEFARLAAFLRRFKKVLSVEEIDRRLEELKKSRRAAFATQYPEPYKEARERIKGFCSANRDAIVANKGLSIVFDEVAPQINSQEARTK